MVTGKVLVNDHPTRSKLTRFIEKKINQWAQSNGQPMDVSGQTATYKVAFTEDEVKQVSCETEILVNGHLYRGWDLAADEQMAFIHSLKRLQQH